MSLLGTTYERRRRVSDEQDVKAGDNYWKILTLAHGRGTDQTRPGLRLRYR